MTLEVSFTSSLTYMSLGIDALLQKLKVDPAVGLTPADLDKRTEQFGNNYREPLKAKKFSTLFWETLDDFMLKVLLVCAVFSIVFEIALHLEEWHTGK